MFFAELLDALGGALAGAGLEIERSVDRFPPLSGDVVYLFVPHEYMPLVEDEAHPSEAHLRRTVAICTEQPGTQWFEEAAAVAARAARAVDINPLGVRELARRGIEATRIPLGYIPAWDSWGGADGDRPVDIMFLGSYTHRRARALAMCGRTLVNHRARLHIVDGSRPHRAGSSQFLAGEAKWAELSRSTLLLNVHRSELAYLEWLRVVEAMINGCVVVTEHSTGFAPLVAGEHFVSAAYDRLPAVIDALLGDPERIAAIRDAAYRFLREELPLEGTVAPLVEVIEEVAARGLDGSLPIPPPVGAAPRELPQPQTEFERVLTHRTDTDRIKAALKELLLGQVEVRNRLAEMSAPTASAVDRVEHHGPRERPVRVSVLLTVYNYADVVGRAIESVALSRFSDQELIVVDDRSSDDSLATIRLELARYPWLPATVVARGRNQGLAAARNCAAAHARGEYLFILDADNQVYPHAFERLVGTLDGAPWASFAYGIIEQFGPDGPRDLVSWREWDPAQLRYGNYIDAMAMIRREALAEAGGYTLDRRLRLGWEDFDLWCAFAERGWRGVRVPEILCRYRTGVYSMISTTDVDGQASWSALVERHTFLTTTNRPLDAALA